MKKMLGTLVLENKLGQVVRTFNWEGNALSVIYRHDTRRIETSTDTDELDEQDIAYTLLAEVTKEELAKKPIKVAQTGELRLVPQIDELSPSIEHSEDSPEEFKKAFKWTAASMVALLALILLAGHFMNSALEQTQEPPRVVNIVKRPTPEVVVAPSEHKHKVTRVAKHKVVRTQKVAIKAPRTAPHSQHKTVALNQIGALGVLGSMNADKKNMGGLDLGAVKASRGPGLGGTQGSGGVQTSMYAKGLVAAPVGPGANAEGAGGYGTHGKGGGQAGYGNVSLIGSSNAYFQPVEEEAEVDGGLDREQIAAVIMRHIGQIRYCYEQGLQVKPGLGGRVAVKFFIGGTGVVKTASVANTSLHSNDVENCIVGHLKAWKFPEPRGGVVVKVNYPFVLKRVSQS